MSTGAAPFAPKAVLAVVAIGLGAFLLFLYAIGAGWDGSASRRGGTHAASNGLSGFSGLVGLLERRGHDVSLSRSTSRLHEESLLVVTPGLNADGEALWRLLIERRYQGPTLLILPKWLAIPLERNPAAKPGWERLLGARPPEFVAEMGGLDTLDIEIGTTRGWTGLGLQGALPVPNQAQAGTGGGLVPLVSDREGDVLIGYREDNGAYPVLAAAASRSPRNEGLERDADAWPIVVVVEPDLLNNYGLADRARAQLAVAVVEATLEDYDLPVVFDLTVAGLGQSENLLTLAFRPPFLAATLCLILAAVLVGWRAFRRFGPPVAELPELAHGKRQLALNGGALVERLRRIHLLGAPYAALVAARIAKRLGVREPLAEARDRAAALLLATRGITDDYPARIEAVRHARHTADLLRAAAALKAIERTLT